MEEKPEQSKKEKQREKLVNIALLAILIIFVATALYLTFRNPSTLQYEENIYYYKGSAIPFRANISDCLNMSVSPDESSLRNILLNQNVDTVLLLVNPNGSAHEGTAAYDIFKITASDYFGIPTAIAYTQYWPEQPNTPNTTIEHATYTTPIIWLRSNQDKTLIELDGPKIIVYAEEDYDLDTQACKISITLLETIQ